jgi:hypothetical protein
VRRDGLPMLRLRLHDARNVQPAVTSVSQWISVQCVKPGSNSTATPTQIQLSASLVKYKTVLIVPRTSAHSANQDCSLMRMGSACSNVLLSNLVIC